MSEIERANRDYELGRISEAQRDKRITAARDAEKLASMKCQRVVQH